MTAPANTAEKAKHTPGNPYHDYLRAYWQDGYDGKDFAACTGDKPIVAWQAGRAAAIARATGATP